MATLKKGGGGSWGERRRREASLWQHIFQFRSEGGWGEGAG